MMQHVPRCAPGIVRTTAWSVSLRAALRGCRMAHCRMSGKHWVILGATGFFAEWLSRPSQASPHRSGRAAFPTWLCWRNILQAPHTGALQPSLSGQRLLTGPHGADHQACKPTSCSHATGLAGAPARPTSECPIRDPGQGLRGSQLCEEAVLRLPAPSELTRGATRSAAGLFGH